MTFNLFDKNILWADAELLVVNKPSGLSTLPDGYDPGKPHLRSILEPQFGRLWVVHRLDRDTSGVLALARSQQTHRSLNQMFAERKVGKIYHAIVVGNPTWDECTFDQPLLVDGDRRHRTLIDYRYGKEATTTCSVIERYRQFTLLEVEPQTGRRHQIRAHLSNSGYPIVVDQLYGHGEAIYLSQLKPNFYGNESTEKPLLGRLGLHAKSLVLKHPATAKKLFFEAPYPKEIRVTIKQFRRFMG